MNNSGLHTDNILSRVTGGQVSNIYGTIQTTGFGSATLYLINPAGVIFGPTAQLNVGGSFYVSTADYVRLNDGVKFYAAPPAGADALLSMAPVAAFGFLGATGGQPTPAPISIQGSHLKVPQGQTFAVVGGNLAIQSASVGSMVQPVQLTASAGRLMVISVNSSGEVVLSAPPGVSSPDLSSFSTLGQVTISGNALLDVSGPSTGPGGGTVIVRAAGLTLDHSTIAANTNGSQAGATVGIDLAMTQQLTVLGNGSNPVARGTALSVSTAGAGHAGNLQILSPVLTLDQGAIIQTKTSNGPAGDIQLNVDALSLANSAKIQSFNFSALGSQGGNINVNGTRGALIPTSSISLSSASELISIATTRGPGGHIALLGRKVALENASEINSVSTTGPGGPIILSISNLSLTGGSLVRSLLQSSGTGASLIVQGLGGPGTPADLIAISGTNPARTIASGLFSTSTSHGTAGPISIDVNTLSLNNGGMIQSGSPVAQGGPITVNATDQVLITGGSSISSQGRFVDIGTLLITSPVLTLSNGLIATSALDFVGGNILLQVGALTVTGGSRIDSGTTGFGSGGSVIVQGLGGTGTLAELVTMSGTSATGSPSGIFTSTGSASVPSPTGIRVETNPDATGAGGAISIQSETLTLADGATISAQSFARPPTATGGSISLSAGQVQMTSGATITAATTDPQGTSIGGNVTITAQSLTMDGSSISATTAGGGNAGQILVTAPSFMLSGGGSVSTSTGGAGSAGSITLNTSTLQVEDGAMITSGSKGTATGAAGSITVQGPTGVGSMATIVTLDDATLSTQVSVGSAQASQGKITITANEVRLSNGTQVSASTLGSGNAGTVTIQATQVSLSGGTVLSSAANVGSTGNGGSVTIQGLAGQGSLAEQVTVSGSGSQIVTSSAGSGLAGSVMLRAQMLQLVAGGTIASTSAGLGNAGALQLIVPEGLTIDRGVLTTAAQQATGGNITLTAGQITLTNGAVISATSAGPGNAGNIFINAGTQLVSTDSAITTQASQASGGNITIQASTLLHLVDSQINASVAGGASTVGGNIIIDPQAVVLQNSQIVAQAVQGQGGNITIVADAVLADPHSLISASSQLGISGTVNIRAPLQNLSGALVPLPHGLLNVTALLAQRCAARYPDGQFSTFTVASRENVPPEPGGLLPAPLLETHFAVVEPTAPSDEVRVASLSLLPLTDTLERGCQR